MSWKYTMNAEQHDMLLGINEPRRICRTIDKGGVESCIATREDVVEWVAQGNVIEEPDEQPES
jgi:hypothetical protein